MANAPFSVDERHQRAAAANVEAEQDNDVTDDGEPIPSIAQLTAAIDPALLASIAAIHTRWAAHLAAHAPSLALSPPASAADLHALSAYVASQLPPASPTSPSIDPPATDSGGASLAALSCLPGDVLSSLLCADGESWSNSGGGVLGNFALLSARQCLREYRTLCELLDNGLLPKPASPTAPRFTRAYLPIAASASQHYLLAPLRPLPPPTRYQPPQPQPILLLPADGSRCWRIATSLSDLLGRAVGGLEGGRWLWDGAVGEWVGEGVEGFCGVWEEGGREWEARQESAVRRYDESALAGLTRDVL